MARSGIPVEVRSAALRQARERALLTQRELGERVGMTNLQISRLETGVQNSTANNMRKIADALQVSVVELIVAPESSSGSE